MLHGGDLPVQLSNLSLVPRSFQPELPPNSLLYLPSDVMVVVFDYLTVDAIYCLSLVCRHLNDLVTKFGWTSYLRSNPRASLSLSCIDKLWTPYGRVRYNTISDRNWDSQKFVARPLSATWRGNLRPQLAISRTRLVVAAGSNLNVYSFSSAPYSADAPVVRFEATYSIRRSDAELASVACHDVTGIMFLPDNGEDQTLLAGFADGYVMCVTLPDARKIGLLPSPDLETLYIGEDPIESLSVSNNLSFSLSSLGKGILRDIAAGTTCEINVDEKGWSSYISSAGAPYVAIGTSSAMPLAVYPIKESSLCSLPSLAFSSIRASDSANRTPASAVYGITGPPPSFPGNPGQIIVSGWFDGRVRIHDLRIPSTSSFTTPSGVKAIPLLSPIITLSDPWATESIYSVSTGGGSGYTVAAGTARHSVVAFWDVRAPRAGWSVHAPGNDTSPVYAVALESSRLFGVTQSRAFVCDFGPDVGVGTYPALPCGSGAGPRNRRGLDDSLRTHDSVRYAVTKYLHRNPMAGG